jgi:hypothetical protein
VEEQEHILRLEHEYGGTGRRDGVVQGSSRDATVPVAVGAATTTDHG